MSQQHSEPDSSPPDEANTKEKKSIRKVNSLKIKVDTKIDDQSQTQRKAGTEENQYEVLTQLSHCNDIPNHVRKSIEEYTPKVTRRRYCVDPDEHNSTVLMLEANDMSTNLKNSIEDAKYTIEGRMKSENRRKALMYSKSF